MRRWTSRDRHTVKLVAATFFSLHYCCCPPPSYWVKMSSLPAYIRQGLDCLHHISHVLPGSLLQPATVLDSLRRDSVPCHPSSGGPPANVSSGSRPTSYCASVLVTPRTIRRRWNSS
ncbi:hypothetical protein VTG60DRAFT_6987 [Thermothelomyces hinnuleus]